MRQCGKYGRREPKRARAIEFRDVWSGNFPTHPSYVDYLAQLNGGWQMLGNDEAGDCVSVTWANYRRLVTGVLFGHPFYPTQDQVWQFYRTQNPRFDPNGSSELNGPGSSADNGMDIQTALETLHQYGGPDGTKAFAFARVDVSNADECKAAIAICGALWTGINVYTNNQDEFSQGVPWDFDTTSPLDGGHSVLTGGYGTSTTEKIGGDEKFITWAAETGFTDNYWSHAVEEAWAVIWPEQLGTRSFEQGINGAALKAAYQQITGQQLMLP